VSSTRKAVSNGANNISIGPSMIGESTGNGGKVGIWGGISGQGTTIARIFDDTMNGILYCDVLQNELKKSIARFPKKMPCMFQQDLAPWHTSKLVRVLNLFIQKYSLKNDWSKNGIVLINSCV
jgi:hypothetical protein